MASAIKTASHILCIIKNGINGKIAVYSKRNYASPAMKLVYNHYGEPNQVVRCQKEVIDNKIRSNELLIKMLASPVNPADINTIQGKYPVKPTLPSIPGNEGVGIVIDIGSQVQDFKPGHKVVFLANAVGTWRTHVVIASHFVMKIPDELGTFEAASLTVNPCTAYRLIKDYGDFSKGGVIIQNGANSAVGQNVIQICKALGIPSVNIIRNRDDVEKLKDYLVSLGATYVLTEEELRKTTIFKTGEVCRPKVALNCVGGKSSAELLRHLANDGVMVTYGGMSREPVMVPTGRLIFNNVNLKGFWMTEWSKVHYSSPKRMEMFNDVIKMMLNDELKAPKSIALPFEKYREALTDTLNPKGKSGKKYVFDFTA